MKNKTNKKEKAPSLDLKQYLKNWGIGLIVIGFISIFWSGFLDPVWGTGLAIFGVFIILFRKIQMLIVIGILLISVGLMNIFAGDFGGWTIFGIIQLYWGGLEIVKFFKFNKQKESRDTKPLNWIIAGIICLIIIGYASLIMYGSYALKNESESTDFNNQGVALSEQEKYEEALIYYDKALELSPNDPITLTNKGYVLLRMERYNEAMLYFDRALKSDPFNARIIYLKSEALSGLGKSDEATQYVDKAMGIDSNVVSEELSTKAMLLYDVGEYELAIEGCDLALEINPHSVETLYIKGLSLYELERYDEAIFYFDKVLAINPTHVGSLNGKGLILIYLGEYTEATLYFNMALAIEPEDSTIQSNRQYALSLIN